MKARYSLIFSAFLLSGCNPGPSEEPSVDDLVGTYTLVDAPKFCYFKNGSKLRSTISLKNDLSLAIDGLPDCINDFHGELNGNALSGVGTWKVIVPEGISSYGVQADITDTNGIANEATLKAGTYNSVVIMGKEKPFQLVYIIGDPDSMERLTYKKVE